MLTYHRLLLYKLKDLKISAVQICLHDSSSYINNSYMDYVSLYNTSIPIPPYTSIYRYNLLCDLIPTHTSLPAYMSPYISITTYVSICRHIVIYYVICIYKHSLYIYRPPFTSIHIFIYIYIYLYDPLYISISFLVPDIYPKLLHLL